MYQVEIDQSGRIDQTNKPTVLAMANGTCYSIILPASQKRSVLVALRQRKPNWSAARVYTQIFSTLLYLLLRPHIETIGLAVIDTEFPGYEGAIKERVMALCRSQGIGAYKDQLTFKSVG